MKIKKTNKGVMRRHLKKLHAIERRRYHPLQHHIHKKHNIAKRTLFYMKEYGSKSNILRTIFKESLRVLIFASIVSSLGGFSLESLKSVLVTITPLIIMLPVLNDLVGDCGIFISSKFTTLLYMGKVRRVSMRDQDIKRLFLQALVVAVIIGALGMILSLGISTFSHYIPQPAVSFKLAFIVLLDITILITLLMFVAMWGGRHFYAKQEDPNNFLIPITTSVADFSNMIVLSILVAIFF